MLVDVGGIDLFAKPTGAVHARCIELLKQRFKGEITVGDFEYELAVAGVDCVHELHYIVPPRRPQVLVDFDNTKKGWEYKKETQDSKSAMEKKVADLPEVQKYREGMHVVNKNWANLIHLEEDLVILHQRGDKKNFAKVWEVYKNYPNVLYDASLNNVMFEKRKWK